MIVAACVLGLLIGSIFRSWRRPELGPVEGRLRPCPDSPNCVCSFAGDAEHAIEPFAFTDPPEAAWARIQSLLAAQPRVKIVASTDTYLHAEFTTPLLRFVDDLELLLDRESRVIHVRSASRVGHSDLGVNRARVESLRSAFSREQPAV